MNPEVDVRTWTEFWKQVRALGLGLEDVIQATGGKGPKEWLRACPDKGLSDLLALVRKKADRSGGPADGISGPDNISGR